MIHLGRGVRAIPVIAVIGLILAALLSDGLLTQSPVTAANGGNNENAKLCQKGGWQSLMTSDGIPFASQDECVSAGAHGIAIVPFVPTLVPPTQTAIPPTETPIPPTETLVPPTETPVPTETAVPPTLTPTITPVPPSPTATRIPASAQISFERLPDGRCRVFSSATGLVVGAQFSYGATYRVIGQSAENLLGGGVNFPNADGSFSTTNGIVPSTGGPYEARVYYNQVALGWIYSEWLPAC